MAISEITLPCKDFGSFDLAVVGGGCTGVFAAVRAARLGLRVAIIEKSNCFGGVATNGLVNVWHSLYDTEGKEQIIHGLTDEVERILLKNGNADTLNTASVGIRFDPNALKWVLDWLVTEHQIHIFFHTVYHSLTVEDGKIRRIYLANKDGLGAVTARFFIDATGDGDLCRDAGLKSYIADAIQPPTPCCFINDVGSGDLGQLILAHGAEFGLEDDWGWDGRIPGLDNLAFRADFHIFGKLCSRARELTEAELEGRQKIYAMNALLKKYDDPRHAVAALCSQIGIRETVHYETRFRATEEDLLLGRDYEDTVMRGTYRVDIHHQHDNGITFKYLDGKRETFYGKANRPVYGNWREELGLTGPCPTCYRVPFELLVQEKIGNLIAAGRMLNADPGAFGALRVMVNLNQLGEAAGVGAYLALQQNRDVRDLSGKAVRALLEANRT